MSPIKETEWVCTCGSRNVQKNERENPHCPKCGRTREYVRRYETKSEDKKSSRTENLGVLAALQPDNIILANSIDIKGEGFHMPETNQKSKEKKMIWLGKIAIATGILILFVLPHVVDNFFSYLILDYDQWPTIWKLGEQLILLGVVIMAVGYYKEANTTNKQSE